MKRAPTARSLFAAARADAPPPAVRAAIWQDLEAGLALVPPAAASGARLVDAARATGTPATTTTSSSVLKAGLIGGGIGSGVTAIAVLAALHAPASMTPLAIDPVRGEGAATWNVDAPTLRSPTVFAPLGTAPAEPSRAEAAADPAGPAASPEDVLAREVALVMGARAALVAGDSQRALDLAARARAMGGQLGHEARTLELRALRALGRDQEADRVEIELRVRSAGGR